MILFLWYIPLSLLTPLLWVLVRRRAYDVAPCFFAYSAFGVASDATRFVTHNYPHPYFLTYWITEAGYCLLGILAMHEVLRSAIGHLPRAWWVHLIFPVILLASWGLSLARTHVGPPRVTGILLWIVTGEIAVRFVQVSIVAGLATLVPLIGLRWRRYSFGVALGFGFFATVQLLSTTRFVDIGPTFKLMWGAISIAAYSLAVLIWIWFFWAPIKVTEPDLRPLGPAIL